LTRETGNSVGVRAFIPNERMAWFYHHNQSAQGMGGSGREMSVLITYSMQLAKAGSNATLPQQ
jgi:hypothetical protein